MERSAFPPRSGLSAIFAVFKFRKIPTKPTTWSVPLSLHAPGFLGFLLFFKFRKIAQMSPLHGRQFLSALLPIIPIKALLSFFAVLFPGYVNYHVFGFAAGLKLDCPVRNPGGHDEIRFAPPFQTVGFRVYSRPLANIINRKKLSSVSMP